MHRDHEYIQILAYRLWEARGRPEGSADQDWLEAERQLSAVDAAGEGAGASPVPRMKLRIPASTRARTAPRTSGPITDSAHVSKKQEPGWPGSS